MITSYSSLSLLNWYIPFIQKSFNPSILFLYTSKKSLVKIKTDTLVVAIAVKSYSFEKRIDLLPIKSPYFKVNRVSLPSGPSTTMSTLP